MCQWGDVNVTHPPVITTAPRRPGPAGPGLRAQLRGAPFPVSRSPRPAHRHVVLLPHSRRKALFRMPTQLQLPYPATVPTASRPSPAFTMPSSPADVTASAAGRSALERRARLTGKLAKLAATDQLAPLARQISTLGGCAHPIRLTGHRTRLDSATGEVLDHFDSGQLPAGELLVRCGNRRGTRCPACSTVYRYDTYQLIAAGLRGGKTVPTSVAAHPRVFATLTAPGFGPVHNQPDTGRCHCGHTHPDNDQLLGAPLDPARYDYAGAVLWNAHAPALWARFTTHLRREIAKAAGLTQRALRHYATLSYARSPSTRNAARSTSTPHPPRRTHRPRQSAARLGNHPAPQPGRPCRRRAHPRPPRR